MKRTSPDSDLPKIEHGDWRLGRPRRPHPLTTKTFRNGVALGCAISGVVALTTHAMSPPAAVATQSIEHVRGTDSDEAPSSAAPVVSAGSSGLVPTPTDAAPEGMLGALSSRAGGRALGSTEVAEQALRFTAFIQAGSVYGSGVLVHTDGYVLTAWHVVEEAKEIHVSFARGDKETAALIEHDTALDLALLKIAPRQGPARTSSVVSVKTGDPVYSMGAPRKLEFSLSRGMVSYTGRAFGEVMFIQTDIPTNSGNSGGPVINERGEVIAVQSFILRDSEGLAFAVPIDYAYQRFASHLKVSALQSLSSFDSWLADRRAGSAASADAVDVGGARKK